MSRVAVLLDCDNVGHVWAKGILAEAARQGTLSVKRGYGDWTSPHLTGWRAELPGHAIQPIQQFAWVAGKNATDSALIIDAMDLLYSGNLDVFYLVSSDSDFTRLAVRLRESGKTVYGIGARHTPEAFRNACDRFTYLDVLPGQQDSPAPMLSQNGSSAATATDAQTPEPSKPTAGAAPEAVQPVPVKMILAAVDAAAKDDGWALLANVGHYIVNTDPTFDSRNFGYAKLSNLAANVPGIETQLKPDANQINQTWVRRASAVMGGTPS
ncbi:NYN domain-containing protein [Cellulomonas sp. Root137]|uniref:NYN domain-containing protein n=1 Tax=Cellulomonas sp. Root137 TaxID=1736459 RepID=UPI0009EB41D9|nr:NYN domain-containing protein [Cellulomonas sp. Root137]